MSRFHEQIDTLIRDVGEIKTNTALNARDLLYVKEEQINHRKRMVMQNQRLRKLENTDLIRTTKQGMLFTALSFVGAYFGIKVGN